METGTKKKLKQYIRKIRKAKCKRGFSIHSPFVFHFVTHVVREKEFYYAYKELEDMIKTCFCEVSVPEECAAQKKKLFSNKRRKYSRFLLRVVNHFKPETVLEIGSGWGIDTLYLSNPVPGLTCTAIEEDQRQCDAARKLFTCAKADNVRIMEGSYLEALESYCRQTEKIDLVCCNLMFPAPVDDIYARCCKQLHEKSVFILKGIHADKMQNAFWEKIKADEKVVVSLDLYFFGILLYDPVLTRKHYTLYF